MKKIEKWRWKGVKQRKSSRGRRIEREREEETEWGRIMRGGN